ncbi:MAG TPA: phosphonate C-P lyase system protein PhnG [Selenomonadales bacterium]|nr:phosphonate C-P lyase system protein PhnG [Selenomonadales bacterium]
MDFREIIAEGELGVWLEAAQAIADNHEVRVLKQPETCIVMLQATDSVGFTPFYLGEVLITEAVVEINGTAGYGFVLEDDPQRALCMAVLEAALAAGVSETETVRRLVAEEAGRIAERQRMENGLVAATRVEFAIMEG